MGRGRIEMNKIDNQARRQVTFSKRRKGLMKKAKELSILCESEVGIIIFSNTGRVYDFASTNRIQSLLERYYEAHGHVRVLQPGSEAQLWRVEAENLRLQLADVTKRNRQLLGEDLTELCLEELDNLENQLANTSKTIRTKKEEKLQSKIQEYYKKEISLHEENMQLHKTANQLRQEMAKLQKASETSRTNEENNGNNAATTSSGYNSYDPVLLTLS